MTFLSYSKSEISTSVAPIYTKLSSLVPSYIMKTYTEGYVNILFLAWFILHFIPKKHGENHFLRLMTVFSDLQDNKSRYP